jgi:hypothetical protein
MTRKSSSARFEHLVGVNDEVLADHRQGAGRARRFQIVHRALEEGHIGQHRQARSAMLGITACNRRGIKVLPQHPFAGARLFHFGNHRRPASCQACTQRSLEPTLPAHGLGLRAQRSQRQSGFCGGDLFALDGDDAVQDVRHRFILRPCRRPRLTRCAARCAPRASAARAHRPARSRRAGRAGCARGIRTGGPRGRAQGGAGQSR